MSLTAGAMGRPLAVRPTSRAAAKRRVSSTVRRAAPARASSFDPLDVAASKSTSAAREVLFPEIVGSTPREWIASASRLGAVVADGDDDAKVNATIESFSTETKVILTTLGKILERLEALELVALRNAKEVARVENALHGFIVGQARKENGKEPITSANLFAVVDSSEEEEEEEEEEEKIEEEIKENIVLRAGRFVRRGGRRGRRRRED